MPTGVEVAVPGPDILSCFFSDLIEECPFALAILDRDLRYVTFSKGWTERVGLTLGAAAIGTPVTGVPGQSAGWIGSLRAALLGKAASGVDRIGQTADWPERWQFWKVWPVGKGGQWVAISLFGGGETAQSHGATSAYATDGIHKITTAMGIGLLEHDFATGSIALSDTYLELLGITRDSVPTTDAGWMDLLRVRDAEAFQAARARALDPKGEGVFDFEVWPIVGGVERCMRIQSRVLFEGEGADRRPHHLVGLLVDRTAERQMEEALARAQRLETVGRLAGMVAHDFNNILSVILGNLELVLPKVGNEEVRALLNNAMEATQMGAGFNKRLLTLAGGHGGQAVRFHLDAHLGQTWEIYRRVLRDDILLQFEPGSETAHIVADPAEIDAAILNLVVNARDVQLDGGRIVISTRRVGQAGGGEACDTVEIAVTDEGPGMPANVAARAGEPFFTTKPSGMGSGLGLASVIASAKRAGGTFRIETGPKGTRAILSLPISDGDAVAMLPQDGEMPLGDGESILVVEDDPLVREAAMQRLEALGYVVAEASNTQSAMAQIESGAVVDLVFSDIILPGGPSGLDMCAALRKSNPRIALLLTSGHASGVYRDTKHEMPMPEILAKPYSLRELAFAVRRCLSAVP